VGIKEGELEGGVGGSFASSISSSREGEEDIAEM
jgi:hypothetical protein